MNVAFFTAVGGGGAGFCFESKHSATSGQGSDTILGNHRILKIRRQFTNLLMVSGVTPATGCKVLRALQLSGLI